MAIDWLSVPVIALVAGILVWRKSHRVFPIFFLFLVMSEIAGGVRFVAGYGSRRTYFYVYWISDLILMILNFLAVYELILMRLFPRFYKIHAYRYMFGIFAMGIITAAWFTGLVSNAPGAWFAVEARVISFVLVATLLFFVSLMMIMGRHWTRYDFGVGFGFAIMNAAVLITSAVWVQTHYRSGLIDELPTLAFDISCLLWLYCFWSSPKVMDDQRSKPLSLEVVHEARTWESMLKTWLTPGKSKR